MNLDFPKYRFWGGFNLNLDIFQIRSSVDTSSVSLRKIGGSGEPSSSRFSTSWFKSTPGRSYQPFLVAKRRLEKSAPSSTACPSFQDEIQGFRHIFQEFKPFSMKCRICMGFTNPFAVPNVWIGELLIFAFTRDSHANAPSRPPCAYIPNPAECSECIDCLVTPRYHLWRIIKTSKGHSFSWMLTANCIKTNMSENPSPEVW